MCLLTLYIAWVGFIFVSQVLCGNSVLDSPDFWLKNEKTLCRLGLMDDDGEGSCTMVRSILYTMKNTRPLGNKVCPVTSVESLQQSRGACIMARSEFLGGSDGMWQVKTHSGHVLWATYGKWKRCCNTVSSERPCCVLLDVKRTLMRIKLRLQK